MRLPIVLGVLAVATTPVWFYSPASEKSAVVQTTEIFGKQAPAEQVASLRVAGWDDATSAAQILEVKKSGGVWTLPSHFDFPADGNTRVTKAASGFLGVQRGRSVGNDEKSHEDLGVLDPLDAATLTKKGHGKRVTITDATGAVLVDLIVGKYVDGASGLYYVREAGSKDVYTAKVDPYELSTKFIDYVETDPFKIAKDDIRSLAISDYSVDEAQGTVATRSETAFSRLNGTSDWSPAAKTAVPEGKKVAKTALDNLVNEVNGLRLAGVRPYAKQWLQARGFYLTKEGLYGNEGSIAVTTKDGLRYWLFFGEVALDDAADKAAEKPKADDKKADDKKPEDKKPEEKKGNNRYLAVFVQYDEAADEVAKAEAAAKKDEKPDATKKDDKKKLSGAERAKKAQERFTQFFYVISDESFKKLRPALDTLFEAKPPEPQAGKTGKTNTVWLDEHGKQPGVVSTASGLQYEVISSGPADGKLPTDSDTVEVKYRGTLVDGEEFDSTKGDATATFGVTGVIKGWTEALKLMRPGDKWKLTIPPALAYGEAGSPPKIGANAILQFEIELLKIK
jgi:FKBP-type peptidyl-prolyl cis-trans isomerase